MKMNPKVVWCKKDRFRLFVLARYAYTWKERAETITMRFFSIQMNHELLYAEINDRYFQELTFQYDSYGRTKKLDFLLSCFYERVRQQHTYTHACAHFFWIEWITSKRRNTIDDPVRTDAEKALSSGIFDDDSFIQYNAWILSRMIHACMDLVLLATGRIQY